MIQPPELARVTTMSTNCHSSWIVADSPLSDSAAKYLNFNFSAQITEVAASEPGFANALAAIGTVTGNAGTVTSGAKTKPTGAWPHGAQSSPNRLNWIRPARKTSRDGRGDSSSEADSKNRDTPKKRSARPQSLRLLGQAVLSAMVLLLPISCATASWYYVSPIGSDLNAGTSPQQAWQTIDRVNQAVFRPGDQVLFQGGHSFNGTLYFDPLDAGTAANPIVITSYGGGRATIRPGTDAGLYAWNVGGYTISNINFAGDGRDSNKSSGIMFYNGLSSGQKLDFLRIKSVDVSGFGEYGVAIGGSNESGYRDVRVAYIGSHGNGLGGIMLYGSSSPSLTSYTHEKVRIDHAWTWQNLGRAGLPYSSGNGIVIGNVDDGVIEYSVAWDNGSQSTALGGPVGIWAWESKHIIIQYNESHHNHTNSTADGGGFDLDGGVTQSVMQYNYSHDNDGPGFLLAEFYGANPHSGNTIRYNVSQNDGRKNVYGGIHVWNGGSGISRCEIHNNTVYQSPALTGKPRGVYFQSAVRDVHVRNNLVVTTGGLPLVEAVGGQEGVLFQGNNYWTSGATFRVRWAGTDHWSLGAWRGSTRQETVSGTPVGFSLDPRLLSAGNGGTFNNKGPLSGLTAYRLQPDSPLIDRGLELPGLFGVDDGGQDFYRQALPQGMSVDIGAHEWQPQ